MTELLNITPGESVYDPTCGTAGMLISAASHLRSKGQDLPGSVSLAGIKPEAAAIARTNLYLHGIREFEIAVGIRCCRPVSSTMTAFAPSMSCSPIRRTRWILIATSGRKIAGAATPTVLRRPATPTTLLRAHSIQPRSQDGPVSNPVATWDSFSDARHSSQNT